MPCPGANSIRDDGRNSTIEVEDEEKSEDTTDNQVNEKEPVETSLLTQGCRGKAVVCHSRLARCRTTMMRLRKTSGQGKLVSLGSWCSCFSLVEMNNNGQGPRGRRAKRRHCSGRRDWRRQPWTSLVSSSCHRDGNENLNIESCSGEHAALQQQKSTREFSPQEPFEFDRFAYDSLPRHAYSTPAPVRLSCPTARSNALYD